MTRHTNNMNKARSGFLAKYGSDFIHRWVVGNYEEWRESLITRVNGMPACRRGHIYTYSSCYIRKDKSRQCRECRRELAKARHELKNNAGQEIT
jgi:hypothetical protein